MDQETKVLYTSAPHYQYAWNGIPLRHLNERQEQQDNPSMFLHVEYLILFFFLAFGKSLTLTPAFARVNAQTTFS